MASSDSSARDRRGGIPPWSLLLATGVVGGVLVLAATTKRPAEASVAAPAPVEAALNRPAAPADDERPALESLAAASEAVSIEMYSAAWCAACARAKEWLRAENIRYHEIDVDQRSGAMGQLAVLNPHRTLPTFDVQGEVLVGFEPDRLASAIRGAASR